MDTGFIFILLVILLAFIFDFTNGFHDAANSIATIVTTGVLSPRQAVIWAAFFNLLAFFIFKLSVANTIGRGLIAPDIIDPYLIFAVLLSAIFWNLLTWHYGLPSSSTHALLGALGGAAFAKGGASALVFSGFSKVFAFILLSPLMGLILGVIIKFFLKQLSIRWMLKKKHHWFNSLQLISSAFLSLTHGGNDAQKTMGIIAALLFSGSVLSGKYYIPFWVVISCYLMIALGTLAGGWRIVHTMGKRITHLDTMRGCSAESSAALVIFIATHFGIPISTTHTVTGSIAGIGLTKSLRGTEWKVMAKIFLMWLLTIPMTALMASAFFFLIKK